MSESVVIETTKKDFTKRFFIDKAGLFITKWVISMIHGIFPYLQETQNFDFKLATLYACFTKNKFTQVMNPDYLDKEFRKVN